MSAETLRRASSRIHHDVEFGQAHGDDCFLLAVADWLDAQAERAEVGFSGKVYTQACAVAAAYLDESA